MNRLNRIGNHLITNNNNNNKYNFTSDAIYNEIIYFVNNNEDNKNIFTVMPFLINKHPLSLKHAEREEFVIEVKELLKKAGLMAQIGYNPGTGTVSFVFSYPNTMANPKDKLQCIIWMMFGLHQEQLAYEERWKLEDNNHKKELLANLCLQKFSKQTYLCVMKRSVYFAHSRLSIVFGSSRRGNIRIKDNALFSDSMKPIFQYSPSYADITGYDPYETISFSEDIQRKQRLLLAKKILNQFWSIIFKQRYLPDKELKAHITKTLIEYFEQNTSSQKNQFHPVTTKPFMIYLYGLPGTGKSSFIVQFTNAFKKVIDIYLEPNKKVEIVRVPLNNISPVDLRRIVHVRGISDWSIERIAEQTIAKGGIVILHLEEIPLDKNTQTQHFQVIKSLLNSLSGRYPEYASNCIIMFTSNYEACDDVSKISRCIKVSPPSYEDQKKWCSIVISDSIYEQINNYDLKIEIKIKQGPPSTKDMRRLEAWKISVGYFIGQYIKMFQPQESILVHIDTIKNKMYVDIVIGTKQCDRLELETVDNYFYSSCKHKNMNILKQANVVYNDQILVHSLIDMYQNNYLRPVVVVIKTNSNESRTIIIKAIKKLIRQQLVDENHLDLCEHEFTVKTDADCEIVFGHPDRLSGTLFRAIDQTNNPIHEKIQYASILLHVNLMGQFMLRDTLQDHASTSHVTQLHKDRLLFIVSVEEDCEISPQLQSRAHCIINNIATIK